VQAPAVTLNTCLGSNSLESIFFGAKYAWQTTKNFCTFVTGGLRLCGLHLLEELLENPKERVVVLAAEYFGHEPSSRHQELAGELRAEVSTMMIDCERDMRLHASDAGGCRP
jgi:hypothetical protein